MEVLTIYQTHVIGSNLGYLTPIIITHEKEKCKVISELAKNLPCLFFVDLLYYRPIMVNVVTIL